MLQLLIDGEFVDSSSGKTFETEDPRTGEVLVEVAEAQEEDVDRAVQAARRVCTLLMLSCCLYMPRPALCTLGVTKVCSLRVNRNDFCEAPRTLTLLALQAFDKGPWPRMDGRKRGQILFKLADLMEVSSPLSYLRGQCCPCLML